MYFIVQIQKGLHIRTGQRLAQVLLRDEQQLADFLISLQLLQFVRRQRSAYRRRSSSLFGSSGFACPVSVRLERKIASLCRKGIEYHIRQRPSGIKGNVQDPCFFPVFQGADNVCFCAVESVRDAGKLQTCLLPGTVPQEIEIDFYKFAVGGGHIDIQETVGYKGKFSRKAVVNGKLRHFQHPLHRFYLFQSTFSIAHNF